MQTLGKRQLFEGGFMIRAKQRKLLVTKTTSNKTTKKLKLLVTRVAFLHKLQRRFHMKNLMKRWGQLQSSNYPGKQNLS